MTQLNNLEKANLHNKKPTPKHQKLLKVIYRDKKQHPLIWMISLKSSKDKISSKTLAKKE